MSRKTKRLYLDVETTGPVGLLHGVHQIAGLIEIDGKIKKSFDINMAPFPHQDIDPAALDICNISLEHMMEYQSPKKGFKQLYKLLNHFDEKYHPGKKFTVIGYNVAFDVDFVSRFFRNNGSEQFSILQNYKYVDVLALVRLMIDWGDKGLRKLGNNRLATLCDFFDIPLKAHDALEDIRATRTLYKALQKRMIKMMRG